MAKGNRVFGAADEAAVVTALAKGATIRAAAAMVGFAPRTLFRRRNASALFREAWEAAVEESARPLLVAPGPGRRWQVKRMRRNRFTRERKIVFLEHFAACCDVQAACREAGICSWTAYQHRRTDPAFAAGWREAETLGYRHLEERALRERIEAMEAIVFDAGGRRAPAPGAEPAIEFWRTMHLLREHKKSLAGFARPGRPPRAASNAEVYAALVKRLTAFGIRVRAEEEADCERLDGDSCERLNGDSYE